MTLPHVLDRTIVIGATPDTVFRFFMDDERWARWWGAGSTIDARPGGRMLIRYPTGVEVSGEVLEIAPPDRIVFTYGYASGTPIPAGGSRVTIRLEADRASGGTRLHLTHEFADAAVRDHHVQGWRYQLSLFSNVVADEVHAGAESRVDGWFEVWAVADAQDRARALSAMAAPDVRFRDRFGVVDGVGELVPHIAGAQRFMPGMRLQRKGRVRQCQGTVLADWIAVTPDGQERAAGTNVFVFGADGRIASVTGFWNV